MWITRAGFVLALSGCSFLGIRTAPDAPRRKGEPPVDCTVHRIPPIVDGTVGGAFVLMGAGVAVADLGAKGNTDFKGFATVVVGLPLILVGLIDTASALYGNRENNACLAARHDQAEIEGGFVARYFCSTAADDSVGSCSLVPSSCELARSLYAEAHTMSTCSLQITVACFDYRAADGAHTSCAPTPDTCQRIRNNVARKSSDVGECADTH